MTIEETLRGYTKPSSEAEKERQDAAEALVRAAIAASPKLSAINLSVLPKGSYKNNTNVRLDSDVDIAVISNQVYYPNYSALTEADKARLRNGPPQGWMEPTDFRSTLVAALQAKAGQANVHPGRVAIQVDGTQWTRTPVDVVPSYGFRRYLYRADGAIDFHRGTAVHPTSGKMIQNWPQQQYDNGVSKNTRTGTRYKQLVRIMKNVENALVAKGTMPELASYFVECLVYNAPDSSFGHPTLTEDVRAVISHLYYATKDDPASHDLVEANGMKWLFRSGQSWTRESANAFLLQAWSFLGLS